MRMRLGLESDLREERGCLVGEPSDISMHQRAVALKVKVECEGRVKDRVMDGWGWH